METRHIIAIVGVVAVFGWQNRVKLKSLASAALAKSSPVLGNSKTAWAAAVIALLTAFWPDIAPYIPWPAPVVPIVERSDVFSVSAEAQRAGEVALLRELAGKTELDTYQAKMDFFNSTREKLRKEAFIPYTDGVADAVKDGLLLKLAEDIEVKK